jgi:hypothetical protein
VKSHIKDLVDAEVQDGTEDMSDILSQLEVEESSQLMKSA